MNKIIILTLISFASTYCSLNNNSNRLSKKDLNYIENLQLIDKDEIVLAFSTSLNIKTSGNFVTNKRIGSYWIDKDPKKSYKHFAFYSEINSIDSVDLSQTWTHSSYLIVIKKDKSDFKVYVSGDRKKYRDFINVAIFNWENFSKK